MLGSIDLEKKRPLRQFQIKTPVSIRSIAKAKYLRDQEKKDRAGLPNNLHSEEKWQAQRTGHIVFKGTGRGVHTRWAFWRDFVDRWIVVDGLSLSDCRKVGVGLWMSLMMLVNFWEKKFVQCGLKPRTAVVRVEP